MSAGNIQSASDKAMALMATASTTLREAIAKSLPVASTQLMTVQIPGTVINTDDYFYDQAKTPFKPLNVRVNEARLCDGMIPLSKIMLGNTGKSVARSYLSALDLLVPVEASLSGLIAGSPTGEVDGRKKIVKDRYDKAMQYLTEPDKDASGTVLKHSKLSKYIEKQKEWSKEVGNYAKTQGDEMRLIEAKHMGDRAKQQEEFLQWLQEHAREFKQAIQARYMDWVVHGYKFNIEFYFGVVDITSGMKRVEASKEAIRNLVITGPDGFTEYSQVNLVPSNWAKLCRDRIENWNAVHKGPTPTEIRAEIRRLENLIISHEALRESLKGDFMGADPSLDLSKNEGLVTAYKSAYGTISSWIAGGAKDSVSFDALTKAQDTWKDANLSTNKSNVKKLTDTQKNEVTKYLDGRITAMRSDIASLRSQIPNSAVQAPVIDHTGRPVGEDETKVNPDVTKGPPPLRAPGEARDMDQPSPWTRISAKVSSSNSLKTTVQSQSAESFGTKVGWGWFASASASTQKTSASAEAMSEMTNLEVEVSMDCMLVNIERPWLHPELFNDADLDVGSGFSISPGETTLKQLVEQNKEVRPEWQQFSSYPTAFVVASNVELSFSGDTQKLESAMSSESSNTSAGGGFGWGPFSFGASGSKSSSSSKSRTSMEATASGMKISMQAPQIISWVQTLLPELPRPSNGPSRMAGLIIDQSQKPSDPPKQGGTGQLTGPPPARN